MNHRHFLLFLLFFVTATVSLSAQTARMHGKVTDEEGNSLSNVVITALNESKLEISTTDEGLYQIMIPLNKKVFFRISLLGYEYENFSIELKNDKDVERNFKLKSLFEIIEGTVITDQRHRTEAGTIQIGTKNIEFNPSPVGGVEGLLKILVGSRNELSSQYSVRGGNFDENLVYVNDFEVYRPFLVKSGQQEGLSFVNSDLVSGVNFSTGGFQSRFGDKMSSVLDVTYKRPKKFGGSVMLSLLGAQGHLEGASKNKKFTYLLGVRQKSNQYLLQSQPTKGQYNPSFTDIQLLLNYRFNDRWEAEIIGNYARNKFLLIPETRSEAFGVFNTGFLLTTIMEGSEWDQFDSRFLGTSFTFRPNNRWKWKMLFSGYQTSEYETYDIIGENFLDVVEMDLSKNTGETIYSLGTAKTHDFARNYLDASIGNIAIKGQYDGGSHFLLWGIDGSYIHINDQLLEWQLRDSAGFTQPVQPSEILMNYKYEAENFLTYQRFSAYLQDNIVLNKERDITLSLGVRANYSTINKELLISPRAQFSIKPKWENDVVFRLSSGWYHQPPFYREMRNFEGEVNSDLKAQKSFHVAGGLDYNFSMWGDRPFKVTAEVFYKTLWDLVPYEYDNLRIRYYADNLGEGFAYGGEVRLFGDLVKDAESWISVGYLNTQNRILNPATGIYSEYFPRPTDQRFTFGMFFSDYLPRNKNFKMYLNLMYASGLPFHLKGDGMDGSRSFRIPDYKRVDIGFSALLLDGSKENRPYYSFFKEFESIWLSAEVFNLLDIKNTINYTPIQNFSGSNIFFVPNRLTGLLVNAKLALRF